MIDDVGHALAVGQSACIIRPYRRNDAGGLQKAADDILVSRYMFAGFPHPYSLAEAEAWVAHACERHPPQHFVIEVDGVFAGAVGVHPTVDVLSNVGLLGYWLNPDYWGRGIATATVREMTFLAFSNGYRRLQATVFEPNLGSARVLEKNGFVLEGRLRESRVDRDGISMDELMFGRLKTDPAPRPVRP